MAGKHARESGLEKDVREYAEATGWWQAKFTSPGKKGVPDRLFIRSGVVLFMELKAEGKRPDILQLKRMGDMKKHGAIVCWCDTFSAAKEWLDLL